MVAFGWAVCILAGFMGNVARATNMEPVCAVGQQRYDPRVQLDDLLRIESSQVATHDIALVNLLCAAGLQDGDPDVFACLATLDEWAELCAAETRRMWPDFLRDPGYYDHAEAVFRMMVVVTVLQRDLGIRYNPKAIGNWDFRDSRDSFLHGLLAGQRLGTCVNMPVLYVAIGRRLGYPVHLALAKGHYFVRWIVGDGTHFNFEGTNLGLSVHADEHYLNWPRPITARELDRREYLRPLTRIEELACFLSSRGHCLEDHGRLSEAERCYAKACQLMPCSSYFEQHLLLLRARRGAVGSLRDDWLPVCSPFASTPGVISAHAARF